MFQRQQKVLLGSTYLNCWTMATFCKLWQPWLTTHYCWTTVYVHIFLVILLSVLINPLWMFHLCTSLMFILSCLPMSRKRISDRHAKEMTLIAVSGLCAAVCIPVPPKPSKYHIEYIWVSIKELLWFRLSAVIPLYCSLSHCEQFPTK